MPVGTGIEQAEAALGVWIKVPGTLRERNNRGRRVAGMQRNIEAFERQAKDLLNDIAPDLAGLPADVAVKMLNDRLIAARAAETRRTESQRRLTRIIRAREGADIALTEAERALKAVAEKLPKAADLNDMLDRLTERDELLDHLEERQTDATSVSIRCCTSDILESKSRAASQASTIDWSRLSTRVAITATSMPSVSDSPISAASARSAGSILRISASTATHRSRRPSSFSRRSTNPSSVDRQLAISDGCAREAGSGAKVE
jgi:hypothetical protein